MAKFTVGEEVTEADLAPKVTIAARAFTPEVVAASLGIAVDQLVDLALVCGNDLTPLLDNESGMAADLSFPIQRAQRTGPISPKAAAQWILMQTPILENPVLPRIEAKRSGFLAALHEVYRFYGHSAAFGKKFRDVEATSSALPKKTLKMNKALLDRYEYPASAVNVMESGLKTVDSQSAQTLGANLAVPTPSTVAPVNTSTSTSAHDRTRLHFTLQR